MSIRVSGVGKSAIACAFVLLVSLSAALAMSGRKIAIGDEPSLKQGAPGLVLVEVADFECPYCGRGARDVLPKVHEKYVGPGKVELVFVDFPLQMHPHAFRAAQAAACAGDQSQFWEMHHLLFANQRDLGADRLPAYAAELGLDVDAFDRCLASRRHDGEIRDDIRLAQSLGITGTPAYLVGRRVPGGDKLEVLEVVKGLPPYEELEKLLDAQLAAQDTTPTPKNR